MDYTAHGKSVVEKRTRIVHERRFEREEISPHHIDDTKEKYEASTHEQGNCMDFDAGIMSTSQRYAPRLSGEREYKIVKSRKSRWGKPWTIRMTKRIFCPMAVC